MTAHTAAVVDVYGRHHDLFGPYMDLDAGRAANHATGHHWFEPGSVRFFGSRVESAVLYGRLFVSSEQQPTTAPDEPIHPRLFSVRCAGDDGWVTTVGEFQQYATKDDALDALHALARGPRCEFTNRGHGCVLPAGHDGDHYPGREVHEATLP